MGRVYWEWETSPTGAARPKDNEEGQLRQKLKEESSLLLRGLGPKISVFLFKLGMSREEQPLTALHWLLHELSSAAWQDCQ